MKTTVRPFRAQDLGRPTTEDFPGAVHAARPTVTEEMVERFREDAERFSRS
jgi:hypothetical protein